MKGARWPNFMRLSSGAVVDESGRRDLLGDPAAPPFTGHRTQAFGVQSSPRARLPPPSTAAPVPLAHEGNVPGASLVNRCVT